MVFTWVTSNIHLNKRLVTLSCTVMRRVFTNKVHDDVSKWKHFPRNWPFVRGIHRSPVNSPHRGQWRGAKTLNWSMYHLTGTVSSSYTKAHCGVDILFPVRWHTTKMTFTSCGDIGLLQRPLNYAQSHDREQQATNQYYYAIACNL